VVFAGLTVAVSPYMETLLSYLGPGK
jgi:hypothetical protein